MLICMYFLHSITCSALQMVRRWKETIFLVIDFKEFEGRSSPDSNTSIISHDATFIIVPLLQVLLITCFSSLPGFLYPINFKLVDVLPEPINFAVRRRKCWVIEVKFRTKASSLTWLLSNNLLFLAQFAFGYIPFSHWRVLGKTNTINVWNI